VFKNATIDSAKEEALKSALKNDADIKNGTIARWLPDFLEWYKSVKEKRNDLDLV
jgi:hypothetical protein